VTVTVNELPAPAESEAMNCFTRAGGAPLTLGAAMRVPINSKAAARRGSPTRLESLGLSTDMSCPFFLAGQTTRMNVFPRTLARDPRMDVTSQRSPLDFGVKGG